MSGTTVRSARRRAVVGQRVVAGRRRLAGTTVPRASAGGSPVIARRARAVGQPVVARQRLFPAAPASAGARP